MFRIFNYSLGVKIFSFLSAFVLNLYLNNINLEYSGQFYYYHSFIILSSIFIKYGADTSLSIEYKEQADNNITSINYIVLINSLFYLLTLIILTKIDIVILISSIIYTMSIIISLVERSKENYIISIFLNFGLLNIVLLALVFINNILLSIIAVEKLFMVGVLIHFMISTLFNSSHWKKYLKFEYPFRLLLRGIVKNYNSYSAIYFYSLIQPFIKLAPSIILVALLNKAPDVAIYNTIVRLAFIVIFSVSVINWISGPLFKKYLQEKKINKIYQSNRISILINLTTSLPFIVTYYFMGDQILSYFNIIDDKWAYYSLLILSISQAFNGCSGATQQYLLIRNNKRAILLYNIMSIMIYLLLMFKYYDSLDYYYSILIFSITIIFQNIYLLIYFYTDLNYLNKKSYDN